MNFDELNYYSDKCSTTIFQNTSVSLPFNIKPSIKVGNIKMKVDVEPCVEFKKINNCDNSCEMIITQKISYKIPIDYSFESNVGEIIAKCLENSNHNCHNDKDCDHNHDEKCYEQHINEDNNECNSKKCNNKKKTRKDDFL